MGGEGNAQDKPIYHTIKRFPGKLHHSNIMWLPLFPVVGNNNNNSPQQNSSQLPQTIHTNQGIRSEINEPESGDGYRTQPHGRRQHQNNAATIRQVSPRKIIQVDPAELRRKGMNFLNIVPGNSLRGPKPTS